MISLVWRTDVHMADRGPSSRKDDWTETVLGKLQQVYEIAKEVKASAVIDGGDFFDVKSPARNTHDLVRRCIDHHMGYDIPTYVTPGNHDAVYGDYSFLPQQPLGVMYSSGAFKRLYDEHEVTFTDDSGQKVRVVGIPYHGKSYELSKFNEIVRGEEDVLICVAHVLASEKGGTMFEAEDVIQYSSLIGTAPDVYCFGHWHKDQGVTVVEGKTFINIGSLTRGSLSQDNVQRKPACAVISCVDGVVSVDVRRLKIKPPEEVFDVDARARQVRHQVEMDAFVNKIKKALTPEGSGEDIQTTMNSLSDVPQEIKERALHYLELVQ